MNPSTAHARVLVDELVRGGVCHAVVAPGSRSAPLALALHRHPQVVVHVEIDERSAGFLALGIAKVSGVPAVVVCTSGTATANLHPAVVEAAHARVPLLVLTADRPPELRDTGANQTIEQRGLYGDVLRWECDIGVAERRPGAVAYWRSVAARALAEACGRPPGPVHVNVPLRAPLAPDDDDGHPADADDGELRARRAISDAAAADRADADDARAGSAQLGGGWVEPLDGRPGGLPWTVRPQALALPPPAVVDDLTALVAAHEHGVLVLGDVAVDGAAVAGFAAASGWPVLAEPHSDARTGDHVISTAELLLAGDDFARAHLPAVAVVVGRSVLARSVRRWLDAIEHVVVVDADGAWLDPGRRAGHILQADPAGLLRAVAAAGEGTRRTHWLAQWLHAERQARTALDALLDGREAPSEPRTARDLAAALPDGALLAVASSMPVRDLSSVMRPRSGLRIVGNRGASGIDGFVSTVLGAALVHDGPVVALAGDLSVLHDQNGFLLADRDRLDAVFVVLNNDGGGIFSLLEYHGAGGFEQLFGTPHGVQFATLASLYGLGYHPLARACDLAEVIAAAMAAGGIHLVEVRTDREGNRALHRELTAAVAAAIAAG